MFDAGAKRRGVCGQGRRDDARFDLLVLHVLSHLSPSCGSCVRALPIVGCNSLVNPGLQNRHRISRPLLQQNLASTNPLKIQRRNSWAKFLSSAPRAT